MLVLMFKILVFTVIFISNKLINISFNISSSVQLKERLIKIESSLRSNKNKKCEGTYAPSLRKSASSTPYLLPFTSREVEEGEGEEGEENKGENGGGCIEDTVLPVNPAKLLSPSGCFFSVWKYSSIISAKVKLLTKVNFFSSFSILPSFSTPSKSELSPTTSFSPSFSPFTVAMTPFFKSSLSFCSFAMASKRAFCAGVVICFVTLGDFDFFLFPLALALPECNERRVNEMKGVYNWKDRCV